MFSSKSVTIIDRPIADVFDYISHMENDPLWCPEVVSVTPQNTTPPAIGKKYDLVARPIPMNQRGWYEITEFEPPTFMKLKLKQDKNIGETWYQLTSTDDGTRLVYTTEVSLAGIAKLFEPLVGWITTSRRGPRMLNNLKKILETEGHTSAEPDTAGQQAKPSQASKRSSVPRPELPEDAAATSSTVPNDARDDLTKIKGIGLVLRGKLNDLGIFSYRQIADFTKQDIDRVDAVLNFPGRIERDRWVEQARALSKSEE